MTVGPQANTPAPALPLDPVTGRVAVKYKDGRIKWLHGVDAREQLARKACVLASAVEAPRLTPGKPLVDWAAIPLEKLREYAQDAGVQFTARTRQQIESDLAASGFVPGPHGEAASDIDDD